MPISVDHDEKRAHVIAVASDLIARLGIEAVTVREIAEAAGCSTAIVSHYFHNKRELLLRIYSATIDHATARAIAPMAAHNNHPKAYLVEIMPLDAERLMEWRIWIAFWAKAAADSEIAAIQKECVRRTREAIKDLLQQEQREGRLIDGVDCELQARRLLTTVIGMAVQVVFDIEDWPHERQHALIDGELRAIYKAHDARSWNATPVAAE
jgi:AcrR family transcriptional regulator